MITDNTERNLQLLQLYKNGHSYAEIAKMYGFSRSWVGAIIRKAGGEKHVRQYKTSDRHRELCNKRYREKKPPKPKLSLYDSILADKEWEQLGVQF